MKIQKLNWAGLRLICGDKTILVDAVENFKPYFPVLGDPLTPLVNFSDEVQADYILFTHLHLDHFDAGVIKKCLKPGGKVIGHKDHEKEILSLKTPFIILENDGVFEEHGLRFKSVYSHGGLGEEQTAWIIAFGGVSIFHGGDTIWHNQFWKLGKENKDINYAFLPVNGVVVNFQVIGLEYSTVPASLTPEQAFNAAKLLHADFLIPIHYGMFATKFYQPAGTSPEILDRYVNMIHQPYRLLKDGEWL